MKINEIIKLIDVSGSIELIGSNASKSLKYSTDYDLQDYVIIKNSKTMLDVVKHFQNMSTSITNTKNVYMTDFKAGTFNTLPVRWSHDDIMKGFQQIDTKTIQLIDTLHNRNNTVKIDLVALIDKQFIEFSCNYYFSHRKSDVDSVLLSLLLDVKKYYHEKQFMKMMKRIMSLRLLKKENVDDIIDFFNSNAGKLYQIIHKIDVIIMVIDMKLDVDVNDINYSINTIMQSIPNDIKKSIKQHKSILDLLNHIKTILIQETNKYVIDFIGD
jgi:hypothetical protein